MSHTDRRTWHRWPFWMAICILQQGFTERGYKQVDVCNDEGIKKHMRVHRLVYMAHKGAIPEGMQINHKDENKANNCIDNLELMTNKVSGGTLW